MLGTLGIWLRNNKISVNAEKSKIIHFRTSSIQRSPYHFKCGDLLALEITHQLNYILRSYTYYDIMASHVASLHIHKSKQNGGFPLNVLLNFTILWDGL